MKTLIFFAWFVLSLSSYAQTYYVRVDGHNSNNGTTPTTAWATLSHAMATVPNGTASTPTIVSVGPGTYAGDSTSPTQWEMRLNNKSYVHIIGAGAGQTIFTRGTRAWTAGTIFTVDGGTDNLIAGLRFSLDTHPTDWAANVFRLTNPDGLVISNVWIDGPMTAPANRTGRRFFIGGTVGQKGLLITHTCISGGGLGMRIDAGGAPNGAITLRHLTVADFTTTQLDDRWFSFDQRTFGHAAPVRVENSIFSSIPGCITAGALSNDYTALYSVVSNLFYDVGQWFHNVAVSTANTTFTPSFFTLANGMGYVTTHENYGWAYAPPTTNQPPVITYPTDGSDIVAMTGTPLSVTVTATDPDTPQSNLIFTADNLPAGAVFTPDTRTMTWDNPLPGVYGGIRFMVSDGESADIVIVTLYVRGAEVKEYYVSPTGSDHPNRDGRTPAAAWRTLTYAASRVEPGTKYDHTRVHILPGTYEGEASGIHGQMNTWHINLGNVEYTDFIGAGPDRTHFTRGTRDVLTPPVNNILELNGAKGVSLMNFSLRLDVSGGTPTTGFDNAAIKLINARDIHLESLYLSGPTDKSGRHGHAIYTDGPAAGSVQVYNCLIEGFSQGFYITANGGYHNTNTVTYSTFVNLDGYLGYDDGVGVWSRAGMMSENAQALVVQNCVFAHLPAAGTNTSIGIGIKNDSIDNMDFWGNVITHSSSNIFYQTTLLYAPNLAELGDATNDFVMNPEFYINEVGLPFVSIYDAGWDFIPEPGVYLVLLGVVGVALRRTRYTH